MKRLNWIWIIVVCLGLSFSVVFAQNKMWVTSGRAKLKTDKKASSKTIATLPMGTEVTVLASEKKWYRVRAASGEEGWMYRGRLSKSPPEQEAQNETDNLFSALPGSDIKADEADTSRSIRGLSSETEEYAKNRRTPANYKKALDQVLALSVSEGEVEKFLSKGKIGEYAP
jgi:uncharacterized protein YgiM (DUF1202 family)